MTPAEKKLAGKFLHEAAEEFGNHGCNDFDLVKDGKMTAKEADAFQKAFHAWNRSSDEYEPGATYLADFAVMDYLADLLDGEADEAEKGKKGKK